MKKLMVIGASISQLPTFKAARKLGVHTIAVDGSEHAPFRAMADTFIHQDFKDLDKVLEIAKQHKIDGIVVPGTDFPVVGAYVAEKMGLPGMPVEVAEMCSNKVKQRKFLKEKGFYVPNFMEVKFTEEQIRDSGFLIDILSNFKDNSSEGLVVKPVDSMSARGARLARDVSELKDAMKDAIKYSRSNTIIVEEFVSGIELSIDSLVAGEKVFTFANADRHFALLPFFIEVGHTNPTILPTEVSVMAKLEFERATRELGIVNGSSKGDIKITDKGIMIGEIAARISGGFLSGWTAPNVFFQNVYPHDFLVKIHLGEDLYGIEDLLREPIGYSAERVWLSIPGKLKEIVSYNKNFREALYGYYAHLHVKEGDELYYPTNNAQRCGSAITHTHSSNRNLSINAAKEVVKDTFLRLEPNNEKTEEFLNSGYKTYIPGNREVDWHSMDIQDALLKVYMVTGNPRFEKVKNFWKYFYAGGAQGGVYAIDSE